MSETLNSLPAIESPEKQTQVQLDYLKKFLDEESKTMEYLEQYIAKSPDILTQSDQDALQQFFGGKETQPKSLTQLLYIFLKQKVEALVQAETKTPDFPDGNFENLNSLTLGVFFLPQPVNKFLSNLYNDYSKEYNQPADTPQRALPVSPVSSDISSTKNYVTPVEPVFVPTVGKRNTNVYSGEVEKMIEKTPQKGGLSKIKEVCNTQGQVILECTGDTPYINKDALPDLLALATEFYEKIGEPLTIISAYRTYSHQQRLHNLYLQGKGNLAAKPGKSGHNVGLSIDIAANDRYKKKLGGIKGMRALSAKYHFSPIAEEDWHFDHQLLHDMKQYDVDRTTVARTLESGLSQAA